jgi:hypothetical protein
MTPPSERPKSSPKKNASAPDVSIADDLNAVDTSVLDKLIAIRKEQTRLKEYMAKADKLHEKVKESVWRRVVDDYGGRASTLASKATPLEEQVRVEYGKLKTLLDRISRVHDEACLAKDELEFRHEVGELSNAQLKTNLKAPEETISQCQTDLAAVEEQQARFLEAFDSEDDLMAAPTVTPPAVAAPAATVLDAAAPIDDGAAAPAEAEPAPDATRVVSPDEGESTGTGADSGESEGGEDRTFLLPSAAVLVKMPDDEEPTEIRLLAVNYLGRSENNQVQIARPGVSRHHALIGAEADGFTLKDLDSQNGTYLNGDRVTEQTLTDGDEIVIGDAELVFRLPWPAESES